MIADTITQYGSVYRIHQHDNGNFSIEYETDSRHGLILAVFGTLDEARAYLASLQTTDRGAQLFARYGGEQRNRDRQTPATAAETARKE